MYQNQVYDANINVKYSRQTKLLLLK